MQIFKFYTTVFLSLLLLISVPAKAVERAKAHVVCEKTDIQFVYDCQILLMEKNSEKPIEGAEFAVSADMPSMAMAHNIKPAMATPGEKPGTYNVRIQLEMYGEWALKLDLKKPQRDRLIHKLHFGKEGASSSGQ
jgi:hypothetical protein